MATGDDELRRALCRAFNTYYAEVFAPLRATGWRPSRSSRCTRPRRRSPSSTTPSASSASAPFDDRRARACARSRAERRCRAARAGSTRSGSTAPYDYDPCGGAASSSASRPRSTPPAWAGGAAGLADELRVQPHRQLRRGGRGAVPVALPRRRAAALPGAPLRLPRGRRRLGARPLRRPRRPLGEAQPRRGRALRPGRASTAAALGAALRGATATDRSAHAARTALDAGSATCSPSSTRTEPTVDEFAALGLTRGSRTSATSSRAGSTSAARPTIR